MNITLDARMGLTPKALAEENAVTHFTRMRESLVYLPLYAAPLKDMCSTPAIIVLSVSQPDPANFPVKISVEIPGAHLVGDTMPEKVQAGRALIRQALDNMDTVLNKDAFVIDGP